MRELPACSAGHSRHSAGFPGGDRPAVINDIHGDMIFAQQVNALGQEGDVLWGLSTSGNSQNVVAAAIVAKARGMKVVAFTGEGGGALKAYADVLLNVPYSETYLVQEAHLPVYHALCAMLEERFFPV